MSAYEKSPLASKKFVAFLVSESSWKALAALALVLGYLNDKISFALWTTLMAIVIVAGFVESGYVLGQASLDKFTRIAELATQARNSLTFKDISLRPTGSTPPLAPPAPLAPTPTPPAVVPPPDAG